MTKIDPEILKVGNETISRFAEINTNEWELNIVTHDCSNCSNRIDSKTKFCPYGNATCACGRLAGEAAFIRSFSRLLIRGRDDTSKAKALR